ncbi:MAG TPA: hypothetical protein VHL11_03975 [Phototrophicaceae bacterium]|nr:hypothetical protein [Phototrophicaceae bacterium]
MSLRMIFIKVSLERGGIHALLRENGTGKSTLMNTLVGGNGELVFTEK